MKCQRSCLGQYQVLPSVDVGSLEFDSFDRAIKAYEGEDYQKALSVMGDDVRNVVERNLVVVEGS